MKTLAQFTFILFLGLLVAACNGDDGGFIASGNGGGSTTTAPGSGTPGTPGDSTGSGTGAPSISFGSGSGDSFKAGQLAVGATKLSAGASTIVRATLVYDDGTPYSGDGSVTFVSNCVQLGKATIVSPAKIANGAAVTTYTNSGCTGSDTITATITINKQPLTATAQINDLAPPLLGSGSGKTFKKGQLSISPTDVAAGGTAKVSASLVNSDGSPFSGNAKIKFNSDCAEQGKATIDSPVNVKDGAAIATYTAKGCVGDDTVTATYVAGTQNITATGKVTVADSVLFGSGTGSSFHVGELQFGFGISKLSTGGSTEIRATLVNDDHTPYTGTGSVSLISECVQQGLATITSPVAVINGAAVATYTNTGCNADDHILATATFGTGHSATATGNMNDVAPVRFGSGSAMSFQDGVLALGAPEISAKGSTTVTAKLINQDGSPFSGDAEVTFTSICAKQGKAILDSQVPVKNGVAVANYVANGCTDSDVITAAFMVGGQQMTATANLKIAFNVLLGSGTGSGFTSGVLNVGIGTGTLSAGGSTALRATLVNGDDLSPYTGTATVTFASGCFQQGQAELDTPVDADKNGGVVSTYTARGCVGADTITATTVIDGHTLKATGTVNVAAATVGSIQFISADPAVISFKGSGLTEASTVTFRVLDTTGSPIAGKVVDFTLSTEVGGITFSNDQNTFSATSDVNGNVQAVVQAGTVHTAVRVKASVEGTTPVITSQSNQLAISTGIADADSFSISEDTFNPEAFNRDGITDAITVYLADRFNNPVPDGTVVSFHTEGGSIAPQCTTEGGTCTVNWTSQNPRPEDGRVTILAYAIGEESFVDKDGDGKFDNADSFYDLGEPYENDHDENPGSPNMYPGEFFMDFNRNKSWDGPDNLYEGIQCQKTCGASTTGIGQSIVLVMSGSHAKISNYNCDPTAPPPAGPIELPLPSSTAPATTIPLDLNVADLRCQTMPLDTTITLTPQGNVTIIGESSFKVENSLAVQPYSVLFDKADAQSTVLITVTTPGGTTTTRQVTFY